jgi:hypothetical protein
MSLEAPTSRCGVLSLDEELVLSLVRELIAGIRADGRVADLGRVEQALADVGAEVETIASGNNARTLRMRSARFCVQACADRSEAIELMFIEIEP